MQSRRGLGNIFKDGAPGPSHVDAPTRDLIAERESGSANMIAASVVTLMVVVVLIFAGWRFLDAQELGGSAQGQPVLRVNE